MIPLLTQPRLDCHNCRELVLASLEAMALCGIVDISLCPGSRNALFVQLLDDDDRFQLHHWPEERSAAFYAVGRIKATGAPAAVITTSGSAAGELLPAMMEAHYSALPLLAVTADRPRRYRSTGAPQCAEQEELFGPYAAVALDLAAGDPCPLPLLWNRRAPAHLNVCLEDPRGTEPPCPTATPTWRHLSDAAADHLAAFTAASRHPLVVVGALAPWERPSVATFLRAWGAPLYLEAPSGLREDPSLAHLRLHIVEGLWERAAAASYPIDALLRIGGIPTFRLWRDLDDKHVTCPLLSIDATPFSGSPRGDLICAAAGTLLGSSPTPPPPQTPPTQLLDLDHRRWHHRLALFDSFPAAEPSLFHHLSRLIPTDALVFLGNSLPIREWDMAAVTSPPHPHVAVNRGINGIDGQLSTFLGMCIPSQPAWGVFGDLTALYDLVAPWILTQRPDLHVTLVVVNNGGGKIFERLFPQKAFLNSHSLSFAPLAEMWSLQYERWYTIPEALPPPFTEKSTLIEVTPDAHLTARFWEENSLHPL